MYSKLLLLILTLAIMACNTQKNNPENWTDEEVNSWFEKQEWLSGWEVQPDESLNKRSMAIHYHKNQRHWQQAFTFLKEADLKNIPPGTQELEGKHLFIAISEYDSKELSETKYESHKKYIDIQYLISGEEQMGLVQLDKISGAQPYNEEKDLVFYDFEGGKYIVANQNNFLVFFPEDAHRPMVKVNNPVWVKKAVVKILIE